MPNIPDRPDLALPKAGPRIARQQTGLSGDEPVLSGRFWAVLPKLAGRMARSDLTPTPVPADRLLRVVQLMMRP